MLFLFVEYFIFVGSFNFGVDPAQKRDNLIGAFRVSRVAGKMSRVQKIVAGAKHFKKNSISYFQ